MRFVIFALVIVAAIYFSTAADQLTKLSDWIPDYFEGVPELLCDIYVDEDNDTILLLRQDLPKLYRYSFSSKELLQSTSNLNCCGASRLYISLLTQFAESDGWVFYVGGNILYRFNKLNLTDVVTIDDLSMYVESTTYPDVAFDIEAKRAFIAGRTGLVAVFDLTTMTNLTVFNHSVGERFYKFDHTNTGASALSFDSVNKRLFIGNGGDNLPYSSGVWLWDLSDIYNPSIIATRNAAPEMYMYGSFFEPVRGVLWYADDVNGHISAFNNEDLSTTRHAYLPTTQFVIRFLYIAELNTVFWFASAKDSFKGKVC